jgi:hypothetical protein
MIPGEQAPIYAKTYRVTEHIAPEGSAVQLLRMTNTNDRRVAEAMPIPIYVSGVPKKIRLILSLE